MYYKSSVENHIIYYTRSTTRTTSNRISHLIIIVVSKTGQQYSLSFLIFTTIHSQMIKALKNFLKKYLTVLKVQNRYSAAVQIAQRQMVLQYQQMRNDGKLPQLRDTGFRVFSQFEEDGLLLFLFSVIGMDNKVFVEIGADDGINSNCANLAFNFGWYGLFLDGNQQALDRGSRFYARHPHPFMYQPHFTCARVTCENINQLIADKGFNGEIGLLSIDIDGNDYWVWEALTVVSPRVVIIETHVEFGYENIVVPYDPHYFYPGKHPLYHGASPVAMVNLARRKGYRLVGANDLGFNFIFVKNGICDDLIPEVSVASVLWHPSAVSSFKDFEQVRHMPYIQG